jgi:hypothetical protein
MTALDMTAPVGLQTVQRPSAPAPSEAHFSFHDLLEIVNPLQHIPVISTLYRWITGDKIPTADKIIGDTIYGGSTGFFASVADTAFEAVTGKDFGDTVLALFVGDDDNKTQVASAPVQSAPAQATLANAPPAQLIPAQMTPAQATPISSFAKPTPDVSALLQAMASKGVDPVTAARAASAYTKTVGLSAP